MRLTTGPSLRKAAMLAALALLSLSAGGPPGRLEYALLDMRFAVSRELGAPASPADVIVLLVTPESEARLNSVYGSHWRKWYPGIIGALHENGARAVIWDSTFVAQEPEFDPSLAEAFDLLPVVAAENRVEQNTPRLREALAGIGWKQFVVSGNIARRTLPDTPLPPLGLVASRIRTGGPDEEHSTPIWIDYSIDPTRVRTIDIADVVLADGERLADGDHTPLSVFRDRIVFIGTDLPGADRYPVPGSSGRPVAGVLSQVASMWSHLSPTPITRIEGWYARLLIFVPAALTLLVATASRRRVRRPGSILMIVVAAVGPTLAFTTARIWMPYAALMAIVGLALVLAAVAGRMQIARSYRTSLGFDPRLLEDKVSARALEDGVERPATIICTDIRNYTQFVTDSPAAEVQAVMTQYMAHMESIVHDHGGYINKFIGDEVVAVFGFPLSEERAQERATRAAYDMLLAVHELNAKWSVASLPTLDGIGIGIDSGALRFIRIGAVHRVQFDVIGAPINGASRIQGLTRQMGRPLIVSAEVAEGQKTFFVSEREDPATRDEHPDSFEGTLEFIGEVMIRGQGRRRLFGIRPFDLPYAGTGYSDPPHTPR